MYIIKHKLGMDLIENPSFVEYKKNVGFITFKLKSGTNRVYKIANADGYSIEDALIKGIKSDVVLYANDFNETDDIE